MRCLVLGEGDADADISGGDTDSDGLLLSGAGLVSAHPVGMFQLPFTVKVCRCYSLADKMQVHFRLLVNGNSYFSRVICSTVAGDHLNDRPGLHAAVLQHRSKFVCAGLACCGPG